MNANLLTAPAALLLALASALPDRTGELSAQTITRVSVASNGESGDNDSGAYGEHDLPLGTSLSEDGSLAAYSSYASNLVPDDHTVFADIFVFDFRTRLNAKVSINSQGKGGNGDSSHPALTPDGRYVAYESYATNLAPADSNADVDVFLHDRQTGLTTMVSVDSSGAQGNGRSFSPSISADGHFVVFVSKATNLIPGDTNGQADVFLRDVQTGMTSRVSVDSSGGQANKFSDSPSISADGRFIAFRSFATNLISGGTNGAYHIYVHDVVTGETSIVSVDSQGNQGNLSSYDPAISADGSVVSFSSIASNLVSSDTNQHEDVFVHDLPAHVTSLVTTNSNGEQGNADSYGPSAISADGRYVAFLSNASNLAPSTGPHEYYAQAYRRDRATGSTTRQSINEKGQDADWDCAALAISRDGSRLSFASPADNLVSGDEYHYWDVFVRASVSLGLNGIPGSDEPLSFSVSNVRVERQVPTSFLTKSLALVMLSCSGMEGFSLPGGQFVYLSFDPCTTAGLVMHDALSARVEIQGDARTPTVVTPHMPAGITIYAAAVILDSSLGEAIAVSDPIWFTTQ